jgi:hypothetical protein
MLKKQLSVLARNGHLAAVPAQASLVTYSVAANFTAAGTVTGTIDIDTRLLVVLDLYREVPGLHVRTCEPVVEWQHSR